MYKSFYKLTRNPFEITPDPSFLFPTKKHNEALASLYYGVRRHKGFVVLTGEVGTGKTLLLRCLMQLLKRNDDVAYAYVFNGRLTSAEFLQYIAADFGLAASQKNKSELLLELSNFVIDRGLKGLTTVLVVDEAHQLSTEILETVLPASVTPDQLGRATKGAAVALLAKTYLFHTDLSGHWQLAAQTAEQVEGMGYQLTSLYYDNFRAATKANTEEIFTVNHVAGTLGIGNELNAWFSPRVLNGYGFFWPTQSLVSNFEVASGGQVDPRLNYCVAQSGYPYFDTPFDSTWTSTGYLTRKMVQPLSEVPSTTKNVGTVNYEALRLSDILLIDAEALNENGQSAQALAPLNMVRKRARESYLYDTSLAGYGTVPAGLLPDIATTDQGQLRDIIRRERRSELALEFHRFFDVIRYGSAYATAALSPGTNFNYTTNRFYPIPQSERDANPNLFK